MQKDRKLLAKLEDLPSPYKLERLSTPYKIWLYLLALIPMFIMVILMFVNTEGISFEGASFTFSNFAILKEESVLIALYNSFKFSFLTTLICLFFGYIIAYTLYKSKLKHKGGILLLLILFNFAF